jgi:hypothetical protein
MNVHLWESVNGGRWREVSWDDVPAGHRCIATTNDTPITHFWVVPEPNLHTTGEGNTAMGMHAMGELTTGTR